MNQKAAAQAPELELKQDRPSPVAERSNGTLTQSQEGGLLQALIGAASNPATDVAKIERLYAMHKEEQGRQQERAFHDALARAQAKLEPVRRNRENTHTQSKYATLSAVLRVVQPAASSEGLSITFGTDASPIPDCIRTVATIAHRDGHKQHYHLDLPPDKAGSQGKVNKTDIQAAASALTYAQRILTKMIFWLSEENDKDGNDPEPKHVAMTEDHCATITAKATEVSASTLGKVLKSYKATKLSDVPDSEYERIISRLDIDIKNSAVKK